MNRIRFFHRRNRTGKIDKRDFLILFAVCLYGLFAMNGTAHLNTVASGILLAVLITLPADKDIYVYAAMIPFLKLIPQGSPMRLYFFFILSILKIFLQKGTSFSRRSCLFFTIWFGLELCLDLLYSPRYDFTLLVLMTYFGVYLSKCRIADAETGRNVTLLLVFSFLSAMFFSALSSRTSFAYYLSTTNAEARFGEDARSLGGAMDLPIFCALAIAIVLTRLIVERHTSVIRKAAYVGLSCICSLLGALTVSRSFVLGIGAIAVWVFLSLALERKYQIKLFQIAVFAFLCTGVLLYANSEAIRNIFTKYSQRNFFASSRFSVYRDCFDYLFTHPINLLFGTGALGYHRLGVEQNLAFQMFAHNLALDAVMSWGMIGTAAFVGLVCSYFHALTKEYGKIKLICYLPLVAWGMFMMVGGTFNYVEPYLYIMILIKMAFCFSREEDNNG